MIIEAMGAENDEKLGFVNLFYVEFSGLKGVIKLAKFEDQCLMFSYDGILLASGAKRNPWADEVLKHIYQGDEYAH